MDKSLLTLVPSGGLGNRLRAVASALCACHEAGCRLRVVWARDWALGARFSDLFLPVEMEDVEIVEAGWRDLLLRDRPRRHNLWLTRPFLRLAYEATIDEKDITPLKRRGFDFVAWLRGRCTWMSCYQEFGPQKPELYRQLFRPVAEIESRVEANLQKLGPHPIGVHIRRTDNAAATRLSPTSLFADAIRYEAGAAVYLATDDDTVRHELAAMFPGRITTPEAIGSRGETDGIKDALVDMFTLARTDKIYASTDSTFSVVAARLGQAEWEELKIKN